MTLIQSLINCIETYYKNELTELQSQVDDLQEQVRNTNTQSNLKDWEIRFLKEDVKRLSAKRDEKRHYWRTEDTED
jgi:peptidoglycan hydrolase CwlO-like protein